MAQKSARRTTAKASKVFTEQERAAMAETARERKRGDVDGEAVVGAKIAEMHPADRAIAQRLHALTKAHGLAPTTWYGMPAYAKDGKVICYFKPAQKFKTRYSTLGFSDKAKLDDGEMWPIEYAVHKLTPADEARIGALLRKAVS